MDLFWTHGRIGSILLGRGGCPDSCWQKILPYWGDVLLTLPLISQFSRDFANRCCNQRCVPTYSWLASCLWHLEMRIQFGSNHIQLPNRQWENWQAGQIFKCTNSRGQWRGGLIFEEGWEFLLPVVRTLRHQQPFRKEVAGKWSVACKALILQVQRIYFSGSP